MSMSRAALALLFALPLRASAAPSTQHADSRQSAQDASTAADDASGDAQQDQASDDDWDIEAAHGPVHQVQLRLEEGTWINATRHGDTIVFDLLGDLWSVSVLGGPTTRLTSGAAWDTDPRFSPDGSRLAYVSDKGGNEQVWLMDADGSGARQLSDEGVARLTDPVWDPSGDWLLVRRRTVDTRSIGVTELWQLHLDGGAGTALTTKDAHPHAADASFDPTGRYLYFSSRAGRFEYNGNPVGGLWRIVRLDRSTGKEVTTVSGTGSAARPTVSPDGRQLAFISRDRTDTLLEVLDLETGRRRVVADWLDHDQLEGFALHGTYPAMAWDADGQTLTLWAEGKLWAVRMSGPDAGARTAIPFRAEGAWTVHDVERWARTVPDVVQARVIRWPRWNEQGQLAFSALGSLWLRDADGTLRQLSPGTGYAPAWSPDGRTLAWTSWTDPELDDRGMAAAPDGDWGGKLHLTTGNRTVDLPLRGQLVNPAWSADGQRIVVLRSVDGAASPGMLSQMYWEVVLLTREGRGRRAGWSAQTVTTLGGWGGSRAPRLFLQDDRVWFSRGLPVEGRKPGKTELVSVALDGTDERVHMVLPGADEVVPSPDFRRVAYKHNHKAYVVALPPYARDIEADGGGLPQVVIADVVGDWLDWSADGTAITWAQGPELHRRELPSLAEQDKAEDTADDGADTLHLELALMQPRHRPDKLWALTHARVLTMASASADEPGAIIEDATVVIDGDRIVSVVEGGPVPTGAEELDCTGKTVIPGLIDVHAHMHYSAGDVLPEQEWRYLVNLDFGVTTVHDPSASTDLVFTQAERVATGRMVGPRVYSTGFVLYGALGNRNAETPDIEAARNHVRRLEALGAESVKVYQQSQRDRRQWYVQACREQQVLCVPEGGGDLQMNLGMVVDGFHAIEHAIPQAPIYNDVLGLWAASPTGSGDYAVGTAYSPTLLVAYGGLAGEAWFYQHASPLDDERLLRHYPRRLLDGRAWRTDVLAADGDWTHQAVARDAAVLDQQGVTVTLGAHGQLQGLGVHWELWALAGPGAMEPWQALRAATWNGARYLGLEGELGSVEAGKLADLVVLDADPLEDIRNSTAIDVVIANGVVVAE